jgi:hypothetical protein
MSEPTTEDWKILKFGKFKSQKITDILDNQKAYCQWLHTQPLIMDSNPKIKELLDLEFKNKDDYYLTFGKYKNKSLDWIFNNDKFYIEYLKKNDYVSANLKELKERLNKLV